MRVRLHWPTVRGRLRTDRGLLALIGFVVALTSALLGAVAPLSASTADRAVAEVVRAAGPGADVVASLPQPAYRGTRRRDSAAVATFDQDVIDTQAQMPPQLAAAVTPRVASLTSPAFQLLDRGPGLFVRLAYVETPAGSPQVTWTAGSAPQGGADGSRADLDVPVEAPAWPVQVGLSEQAATALHVAPGDGLSAEDEFGQLVDIRVTGVYAADDPADDAWGASPGLLRPSTGLTDGIERISVTALVPPAALPDLLIAVPSDQLTQQLAYAPVPHRVRWQDAAALRRAVVRLEASPGLSRGEVSWGSVLDRVLDDALAQVSTARGQSQVLLVGLFSSSLLVLVLAAQLLVRRRAASLSQSRERGATLVDVAAELAAESLLVAVVGAAAGVAVTTVLLGSVGWGWVVPVVAVAVLASPALGAVQAALATDVRRVPANRAARRTAQQARRVRRLVLEATVIALAAVSHLALRQRGPVDGDLTTAGASTWWAVAGGLVLVRALPPLVRLALRVARRTTGRVRFFVAAQVAQTGLRAVPLLVVAVAVTQLVFGGALAATEQRGQEAGALLAVGGDARLTTAPDAAVARTAAEVSQAAGVRAAVAARVQDGVAASADTTSASVRLVVVDAAAYEQLLATSALPDAPQLSGLAIDNPDNPDDPDGAVPALLFGGPAGLADQLQVRWGEDDAGVALDVVGQAPRVEAASDPVVVVDSAALAAAGALAAPDTVWAVGPGAARAVHAAASGAMSAGLIGEATVTTYDDVLSERRDAPLASALVRLALASAVVLLLLAGLGVVLGAAAQARVRAGSLGRLRSLGLSNRELRQVVIGELLVPVAASVATGLVVGAGCAAVTFGSLRLELVTGQSSAPGLVVPASLVLAALVLLLTAAVVALRESSRLRATSLATLLRTGDAR